MDWLQPGKMVPASVDDRSGPPWRGLAMAWQTRGGCVCDWLLPGQPAILAGGSRKVCDRTRAGRSGL